MRRLFLLIFLFIIHMTYSFTFKTNRARGITFKASEFTKLMYGSEGPEKESSPSAKSADGSSLTATTKKSLEEKMKDWESTEEEINEKSLGGLYVGRKTGAFENGIVLAVSTIGGASIIFAVISFFTGQN